ncbi:hypothetical protein N9K77_00475 [bacterium]|nr:hypothetical protein [bacterium]
MRAKKILMAKIQDEAGNIVSQKINIEYLPLKTHDEIKLEKDIAKDSNLIIQDKPTKFKYYSSMVMQPTTSIHGNGMTLGLSLSYMT